MLPRCSATRSIWWQEGHTEFGNAQYGVREPQLSWVKWRRGLPDGQVADSRLCSPTVPPQSWLMRSTRFHAVAVTLALVLVQVGSLTSAGQCDCGNANMDSMGGMAPASPHGHMPAHEGTQTPAPCSHPMSHSECGSMAACGIAVMALTTAPIPAGPAPAVGARLVAVTTPRSVARAPEPPPPRA